MKIALGTHRFQRAGVEERPIAGPQRAWDWIRGITSDNRSTQARRHQGAVASDQLCLFPRLRAGSGAYPGIFGGDFMRRKIVVVGLALLSALAVSLVAWAANRETKPKPTAKAQDKPAQQARVIPEHLMYWHMFHHKVLLDKKADELEKQGQNGSAYRSRYKTFANLSDKEAQILDRVAQETYDKVTAQDEKAKKVIDAIRAQGPDGKVQPGQSNPEVPERLKSMQKERDAMILAGITKLRNEFGPERSADLDRFVKEQIGPNFKNLTPIPAQRNFDPRADLRIQQKIKDLGRSK
jgi:Spy/CpxP family protein refolding chaperone